MHSSLSYWTDYFRPDGDPPGGEYRWHYDRNAVTAILYLNEVPGGETEIFPNFRLVFRRGRCPRSSMRGDVRAADPNYSALGPRRRRSSWTTSPRSSPPTGPLCPM